MSNLINPQIKVLPPERVYIHQNQLTKDEIITRIQKLHIMARDESSRKIYFVFDKSEQPIKYEVCFPHNHLNLKKYQYEDFKVIERHTVATCEFEGGFDNLLFVVTELEEFVAKQGYSTKPPYSFNFALHKKTRFSKKMPKSDLSIQIPIYK